MATVLKFVLGLALCAQAFIGLTFFVSSIKEKEQRATVLGGLQFLVMLIFVILFLILNAYDFFDKGAGFGIMVVAIIVGAIGAILFFGKFGVNSKALLGTRGYITGEVKKWDERDIQFSNMFRMMYIFSKMGPPPGDDAPGLSPNISESDTPPDAPQDGADQGFGGPKGDSPPDITEMMKNVTDDDINSAGLGPLGPAGNVGIIDGAGGAQNGAATNAAAAIPMNWAYPDKYSPAVSKKRLPMSPDEAATRVKGFAKNIGASLVGITKVDQNYIFSHRGCSGAHLKEWGKEIKLDHTYAVMFAEEMAFDTIQSAPHTPIIIESMKNYAKGAFIGAQIANYIANMGYSSRANHMASYDGNMVPHAIDAGLGELGRLGFLMTKEFGPRIRLGMVTTDLPMAIDKPVDIGVQHFCEICKKCATTCPSKSIPDDEKKEVNGSVRWKLNDDTCFGYWQKVGTDCGVCMRVCPWSHDRTFPHKVIVEAVSRSKFARIIFNKMDDVFYGKKPRPKSPPAWADFKLKLVKRPLTVEERSLLKGTWKMTMDSPMGKETITLNFQEDGDYLKGTMVGKMGKYDLQDIMMDGSSFGYNAEVKSPMGKMKVEVSGIITGNNINGSVYTAMGPSEFEGVKEIN